MAHVLFLQQNHEGTVTHLTDGAGAVIERYRYDAFGAPTIYAPNWSVRANTIYDNRFLFTGREYAATYRSTFNTPAFKFYEYRARAYNPELGRFMSEDPKLFDAGDYNLFRYCHNDPVDFTDPMGLNDTAATYSPRQTSEQKGEEDNSYNFIMGLMQRQFNSGISAGMAGYQASSAWSAQQASHIARAEGTAEASNGHLTRMGNKEVFSALRNKYEEVSAAHLDKMSNPAFWRFQRDNNTAPEEFYNPRMYQYSGTFTTLQHYHNGVYSGHEINYMAIGEGFAARGLSTERMATAIVGWRYGILGASNVLRGRPFGGLNGGEYPWALVGYLTTKVDPQEWATD